MKITDLIKKLRQTGQLISPASQITAGGKTTTFGGRGAGNPLSNWLNTPHIVRKMSGDGPKVSVKETVAATPVASNNKVLGAETQQGFSWPTTYTYPSGHQIDFSQYDPELLSAAQKLIQGTFSQDQWINALGIAAKESGMRPMALSPYNTNGSRDWGLFQLNDSAQANRIRNAGTTFESLLNNPNLTTKLARDIYDDWGGWGAWSTASILGL